MKPYAQSCDQNRQPIFEVLAPAVTDRRRLLEIGSGTGQHAVWFGQRLPQLVWQTSDLRENHPGIRQWVEEAALPNVRPPIELDTRQQPWPEIEADCVFSANTAHIMADDAVEAMFRGVAALLPPTGIFLLYGPFHYGGRYTAPSNERFDQWLKQRDPASGIKDFDALDALAEAAGMQLIADHAMPANNRTLIWRKRWRAIPC